VLAVALGVLAAAAVISTVAGGARMSSTFESGTEPFPNVECPHFDSQFAHVTSPVREGKYAARFSVSSADVWLNGSVRCLVGNYHTGETVGDDYFYRISIFIPSTGISDNLFWELHHPASLYNISSACSVAPHALVIFHGRFVYRLFAGNCTGSSYTTQLSMNLPRLSPPPRNVWIDFVIHIKFEETATGLIELYYRTGTNRWPAKPLLVRRNVPTMPYSNPANVHNVRLYEMLGIYPGVANYTGNDSVYIDDVRREGTLAAAERTAATTGSERCDAFGCRPPD